MKNQRQYDHEFKLNAVKLYRESGKGLSKQALYRSCFKIWDFGFEKASWLNDRKPLNINQY